MTVASDAAVCKEKILIDSNASSICDSPCAAAAARSEACRDQASTEVVVEEETDASMAEWYTEGTAEWAEQ
jgi:hypothetical protein